MPLAHQWSLAQAQRQTERFARMQAVHTRLTGFRTQRLQTLTELQRTARAQAQARQLTRQVQIQAHQAAQQARRTAQAHTAHTLKTSLNQFRQKLSLDTIQTQQTCRQTRLVMANQLKTDLQQHRADLAQQNQAFQQDRKQARQALVAHLRQSLGQFRADLQQRVWGKTEVVEAKADILAAFQPEPVAREYQTPVKSRSKLALTLQTAMQGVELMGDDL